MTFQTATVVAALREHGPCTLAKLVEETGYSAGWVLRYITLARVNGDTITCLLVDGVTMYGLVLDTSSLDRGQCQT